MKRVEVERKVIEIKYEAADGRIFETEEACRQHEKNYGTVIRGLFENIPHVQKTAYDICNIGNSDEIFIMRPRNLDDIKVINEYKTYLGYGEQSATSEMIGKDIIFPVGEGYDWIGVLMTVEDFLSDITNELQKLSQKLEEKINPVTT